MAFTKQTQSESHKIVSDEETRRIEDNLKKIGKTKLSDLTHEEKNTVYWDRV
jgi:hypothetical protein